MGWKILKGSLACGLMLAGVTAQAQSPSGFLPGEELLVQSACISCHEVSPALQQRLQPATAPDLAKVGARLSPSWMRKFLDDPRGLRPHGNMPNMLEGLSPEERVQAGSELTSFLSSLGGPFPQESHGTSFGAIESGRQLFHSVGCVACHRPFEDFSDLELSLKDAEAARAADPEENLEVEDPLALAGLLAGTLAPRNLALPEFAPMTAVAPLADFLLDPHAVRPSGLMPNMSLSRSEAEDIAVYLLRGQLDQAPVPSPGLSSHSFKGNFSSTRDLSELKGGTKGVASHVTVGELTGGDNFGLRLTGSIAIPTAGEWTLHLRSDDGSLLRIDGREVIRNWGVHGSISKKVSLELSQGKHSIEVHFFEMSGGDALNLEWEGPGVSKAEVPPSAFTHQGFGLRPPTAQAPDPDLVARGSERFVRLGCAACHTTGTPLDEMPLMGQGVGPPMANLAGSAVAGCLSGDGERNPRWSFDADQNDALQEFLDGFGSLQAELDSAQRLARSMTRLGCVHCHRRSERGGVHPWDRDYFQAREGADLGDEGRLPPQLDGVGAKLQLDAIHGVLTRGERVRPYMTTRMPQYGEQNVGWMAEAFAALDPDLPTSQESSEDHLALGVQLLGTEEGLGCIQCHDFGGTPSLGIRAVDLATIGDRLKPGWFEALLRDPGQVNMNTRMAELFVDGKSLAPNVLGGDPMAQIRAVWQALSLGNAMPPPPGLITPDSAFELRPLDRIVTCGVFMRDMSPRTLVVGFPEMVHYAFDMQNSRLGRIWQGRFFNARGTWEGRAGSLEMPPGSRVIDMPPGMALARLDSPEDSWPTAVGAEAGFHVLGRQQVLGEAPVFRYGMEGVTVEETLTPVLGKGRRGLLRRWTVVAENAAAAQNLVLRPMGGAQMSAWSPKGLWRVTLGGHDLDLSFGEGFGRPPVSSVSGELRWPIVMRPLPEDPERFGATLSLELVW